MVKGVNRNIIEIIETGNHLFERAILFVNPASSVENPADMERHARRYLDKLRLRQAMLRRRRWLSGALRYILAALAGALAMGLILGFG